MKFKTFTDLREHLSNGPDGMWTTIRLAVSKEADYRLRARYKGRYYTPGLPAIEAEVESEFIALLNANLESPVTAAMWVANLIFDADQWQVVAWATATKLAKG